MQLAAFSHNQFVLGHAAMLINEGLPAHLVTLARRQIDLSGATAGVLGMAFKGESDDPRSSLSYKLKKLAGFKGARVLCHDPYVPDTELRPLEEVLGASDVLIIGAPHKLYRDMPLNGHDVVDIWGVTNRGIRL